MNEQLDSINAPKSTEPASRPVANPSSDAGRKFVVGMADLLHSQLCSVYSGLECDCFKADILDWVLVIEDEIATPLRNQLVALIEAVTESRVAWANYETDTDARNKSANTQRCNRADRLLHTLLINLAPVAAEYKIKNKVTTQTGRTSPPALLQNEEL